MKIFANYFHKKTDGGLNLYNKTKSEQQEVKQESVLPSNTTPDMPLGKSLKSLGKQALNTLTGIGSTGATVSYGMMKSILLIPTCLLSGLFTGMVNGAIGGAIGVSDYCKTNIDTPIGVSTHNKILDKTHSKIVAAIGGTPAGFLGDGFRTSFILTNTALAGIMQECSGILAHWASKIAKET